MAGHALIRVCADGLPAVTPPSQGQQPIHCQGGQSPGRLGDSGEESGVGLLAHTDTGQPELPQVPRGRPSTLSRLRTRVALASRGWRRSSASAAARSGSGCPGGG